MGGLVDHFRRRHPARAMLTLPLLVVLLTAAVTVLPAPPAHACSCMARTTAAVVQGSAEVLIGIPVEEVVGDQGGGPAGLGLRRAYRIEVREVLKGQVPAQIEVWTGSGGGDCGVQLTIGEEVALAPWTNQGVRTISICGSVLPIEEVRRVPVRAPPPTGEGPAAFAIAADFGNAWLALLDGRGRPLGYASDGLPASSFGSVGLGVCDGGRKLATARYPDAFGDGSVPTTIAMIDTATLVADWAVAAPVGVLFGGLDSSMACVDQGIRIVGQRGVDGGAGGGDAPMGPVLVVDAGPDGGTDSRALVGTFDGAVDPRDGSVVTVDGRADDPARWRLVRRADGRETDPVEELASIVLPPGAVGNRRVVAVAIDHEGRIAVAHGPRGVLGREIDRIETFHSDGTPIGSIDPGIPASPVHSIRWGAAGELTVVATAGAGRMAFGVAADGSGRRGILLESPSSMVLSRPGTDVIGFDSRERSDVQAEGLVVVGGDDGPFRPFGPLSGQGGLAVPEGYRIELEPGAGAPAGPDVTGVREAAPAAPAPPALSAFSLPLWAPVGGLLLLVLAAATLLLARQGSGRGAGGPT